jgi:hypothetical protein
MKSETQNQIYHIWGAIVIYILMYFTTKVPKMGPL